MTPNAFNPLPSLVTDVASQGHTVLTRAMAQSLARKKSFSWTPAQLDSMLASGEVVRVGTLGLSTPSALEGEARLAAFLARVRRAPPGRVRKPIGPPPGSLRGCQEPAWGLLASTIEQGGSALLSGLPGAGKTYLVSQLVKQLEAVDYLVRCATPTGKAASVLALKLDGTPVRTIHSLIGLRPGQVFVPEPVLCDVLFVDESSMIDAPLMGCLIQCIEEGTSVIFVGDPNQLPPVGAGCPFADMIRLKLLPHAHLTGTQRQAEGSGIIRLATDYAHGRLGEARDYANVHHFRVADDAIEQEAVDLYCSDRLEKRFGVDDTVRDTVILSPVKNRKYEVSTERMNEKISHRLFPSRVFEKCKFTQGDRVMFTVNDYQHGFVNGEMGRLEHYNRTRRSATIINDYGTRYHLEEYSLEKYAQWGYGLTVHKAQGSESKIVVMLLHPEAGFMYSKNLVYTALTRVQQELIIIGDWAMLRRALDRVEVRTTALEWLVNEPAMQAQIIEHTTPMDMSKYIDGWVP